MLGSFCRSYISDVCSAQCAVGLYTTAHVIFVAVVEGCIEFIVQAVIHTFTDFEYNIRGIYNI